MPHLQYYTSRISSIIICDFATTSFADAFELLSLKRLFCTDFWTWIAEPEKEQADSD